MPTTNQIHKIYTYLHKPNANTTTKNIIDIILKRKFLALREKSETNNNNAAILTLEKLRKNVQIIFK